MGKTSSLCGTYGCTLPDRHYGLCHMPPINKRRTTASNRMFCVRKSKDLKKHAVLPEFDPDSRVDERGDVLIEDPVSEAAVEHHLSPPPSPYPVREPVHDTSRTASPTPSDLERMGAPPSQLEIAKLVAFALYGGA